MIFYDILLYLWNIFSLWAQSLFVLPFQNPEMLWILVPLWLSWFFGEFFQEKEGTSYGNAISNAVIVLWAGIDCLRQTINFLNKGEIFDPVWIRFALCAVLISYGLVIIIYGTKVKDKVKNFGRIRDVTYAFAILVPVLYNVVPLTLNYLIGAILFFPLFHFTIQLIDLKIPSPMALKKDEEELNELQDIKKSVSTQIYAQSTHPDNDMHTQQQKTTRSNPQVQGAQYGGKNYQDYDDRYKRPPITQYWNE